MAVNLGSAIAYLDLNTQGFDAGLGKVQSAFQTLQSDSADTASKLQAVGGVVSSTGKQLTTSLTVPLVGLGTASVKAASDFESAFTGVRKTVDATEEDYARLSDGILEMSERMPTAATEIAGVMEVAGQLGIRGVENLLNFTETMVMLGDTTNLTAEDAATSLARVMNIMGTADSDIGRLGSTVVALGNNYATTESEIVAMTNRLAAGAKLAGFTEAETMALATAMSSVGIEAEAGGTAMTQTFNAIEKAVAKGGENLDAFASVAGMTAGEFADAWETTPVQALQSFITGLGQLDENGGNAVLTLEELGLTGIRQSNMLKSLGLASEMLGDAIDTANVAWGENSALTKEAEQRYATFASQLSMFLNTLKIVAIQFGEIILPYLQEFLEWLKQGLERFAALDESTKRMIVTIAAVVAAIGPALMIVGKLVGGIGSVLNMVKALPAILGMLTSPIGLIIAGIVALGAAYATNFGGIRDKIQSFVEWISATIGPWLEENRAIFENWFSVIKDAFGLFWEAIESIFGGAIDFILGMVKGLIQIMTGDVDGGLQTILDGVQSFWQNLYSALGNILEGIIKILVTLVATLYEKAREAIQSFWDGCKSVWESVKAWFNTAKEDPVKALQQLVSSLRNVGSNIINGFLSGLRSAWQSVVSWVNNAVSWIKNTWNSAVSSVRAGSKGSYATGLDYVPRTMQVTVHEGERILTKEENRNGIGLNNPQINIYVNADVSNDYDVNKLGHLLGKSIRDQIRSTGGNLAWN